ncbi:MAG: type II toxin-antitoxin system VapB family antitoxin [Myxococcota bacterium]|nr:type II toxin-antitoxin system VapB family antitoxin [Myxococcota bacterium]
MGWPMASNMNSPEIEKPASEVARLAGETPHEAVRRALEERRSRLARRRPAGDRADRLRRFLEAEVYPLVPPEERGRRLSREEEDALLGFGEEAAGCW